MLHSTSPDVQKALVYYLGSRVLFELLDKAVEETQAVDWGGDTGCFPVAFREYEKSWDAVLKEGGEMSLAATVAIVAAIMEGTIVEQTRLGRAWVTPVRKYIKDHWHEVPTLHDPNISDSTSVGSIWTTFNTLFENRIESALSEHLLAQDYK